ncbi:MAG TPA: phosphohydrolase, partial [Lachnospiraceae bacterium]|nr:phosphohydrolase [Lachnospiraceae bacterium]
MKKLVKDLGDFPVIETDFMENIVHGMMVSKLAYMLGKELNFSEERCHDLAVAG